MHLSSAVVVNNTSRKDWANKDIAGYHETPNQHSWTLILDEDNLCTTKQPIYACWNRYIIHIPNNNKIDEEQIHELMEAYQFDYSKMILYHKTSTDMLNNEYMKKQASKRLDGDIFDSGSTVPSSLCSFILIIPAQLFNFAGL